MRVATWTGCLAMVVLLSWSLTTVALALCTDEEFPLFHCETERKQTFIALCATEASTGKRWRTVQYRFGTERRPEMVYPRQGTEGGKRLAFAHYDVQGLYTVTVRFTAAGATYRLYSTQAGEHGNGAGEAGVTVSNSRGTVVSTVRCAERPYMFPGYLQEALACDTKNPHGKAACGEIPFTEPRARP